MTGGDAPPQSYSDNQSTGKLSRHGSDSGRHGRRLVRPSNLPRSGTLPNLQLSEATATQVSNMRLEYPVDQTTTSTSPKKLSPSIASVSSGASSSANAVTASTSTKKKGRGFLSVFKSKAHRNTDTNPINVTQPLPDAALKSPKALKLLGLPANQNDVDAAEDSCGSEGEEPDPHRYDHEDIPETPPTPPVRPSLRKKISLPWLTRSQKKNEKRNVSRESLVDGLEDARTTAGKDKDKGGNKALRVLELIRPKSSGKDRPSSSGAPGLPVHDFGKLSGIAGDAAGYQSDEEVTTPRTNDRPPTKSSRNRGRRRRKGPKSLERMSPITEASSTGDIRWQGRADDGAELEVISEYDQPQEPQEPQSSTFGIPRSMTDPFISLPDWDDEERLLLQQRVDRHDQGKEEHGRQRGKYPIYRSTTSVQGTPGSAAVPLTSPLQAIERTLLKNTEEKMQMDIIKKRLAESHEKLKKDLEKANNKREGLAGHSCDDHDETSDADTTDDVECKHDLIDLIPSDEEPVIEVARAVTITRVTPGMVKLIDIPPRKSKQRATEKEKPPPSEAKAIPMLKLDAAASSKRAGHADPKGKAAADTSHENHPRSQHSKLKIEDLKSGSDNLNFSHPTRKSSRPPREASHARVEGWIQSSSSTAPVPPAKNSPSKHHCVQSGHLFRPIDFKRTPDAVAINELEVSPYLINSAGVKEHVCIPFACQNCGKDVNEEVWECEVPVCRLSVCYACAVHMEKEREDRAVGGWKKSGKTEEWI